MGYFKQLKDVQDMMEPDLANKAYAIKQNKIAKAKRNLEDAKYASKFWSSWRGTANKLPVAMSDTLKKTVHFVKGNK
jgi:hypothetical protein